MFFLDPFTEGTDVVIHFISTDLSLFNTIRLSARRLCTLALYCPAGCARCRAPHKIKQYFCALLCCNEFFEVQHNQLAVFLKLFPTIDHCSGKQVILFIEILLVFFLSSCPKCSKHILEFYVCMYMHSCFMLGMFYFEIIRARHFGKFSF